MVLKSLFMSVLLIVPTHAQSSSLHNSSIPTAPRSETSPSLPITSSGLEQTGTTKAVTLEPPKTSCPAGTTTVKSCWVCCEVSATPSICHTTSCTIISTGCDLESSTTTSVTSSSALECPFRLATPYNGQASQDKFGIAAPSWFNLPLAVQPEFLTNATTSSTSSSKTSMTTMQSIPTTSTLVAPATTVLFVSRSLTRGKPPGSTCASSTTFPVCSDISASQVCTPTTRCASWKATTMASSTSDVPTSTSTAPVVFTTTLPEFKGGNDLGNVVRKCHDVSKFPGHGDLSGRAQRIFAVDTCEEGRKVELSSKGERIAERKFNQESFVNYDFYIHWIPGCRLKNADGKLVDRQKVDFKTTSDNKDPSTVHNSACMAYFVSTYKQCNNEGVGGSIEAGCLKYTFTGGRFEELIDYWNTVVPI